MLRWFGELDRILRGEATRPEALDQGAIRVPLFGMAVVSVLLAMTYGLCMGSFALTIDAQERYRQTIAAVLKMPALFAATLLVTFPSLYVFNALVGSRLRLPDVLKLVTAALGVCMAVLASLGPIVAFFSVTSTSYPFIVLLNVVVCAVAGFLGLSFLIQTLNRLSVADWLARTQAPTPQSTTPQSTTPLPAETPFAGSEPGEQGPFAVDVGLGEPRPMVAAKRPGPLDGLTGYVLNPQVRGVFLVWITVFGLVGGQMSWLLRPFIGNPDTPFTWFRPRDSNFFEAVYKLLWTLLAGNP
jgi:hypothetical protein